MLTGAIFLQHQRGARLLTDPLTLVFALLAMLTSAIYSIADAQAVRQVQPVVMFWWQAVIALPVFALMVWARHGSADAPGAGELFSSWFNRPRHHLAAGSLAYLSYVLILMAYQLGGNVAAVTSVRQASIPISVIGAALFLNEASMGRRLLWSLVLTAGIVVVVSSGLNPVL